MGAFQRPAPIVEYFKSIYKIQPTEQGANIGIYLHKQVWKLTYMLQSPPPIQRLSISDLYSEKKRKNHSILDLFSYFKPSRHIVQCTLTKPYPSTLTPHKTSTIPTAQMSRSQQTLRNPHQKHSAATINPIGTSLNFYGDSY